jgi:hypothetical protein
MWPVRITLAIALCTPAAGFAQTFANADTVEAYGLLVIGAIDKFEYGANEALRLGLRVENPSDDSVTIPGATYTCATWFVEETWCRPDSSACWESPPDGWCARDRLDPYPPGTTWLFYAWDAGRQPGNDGWVHDAGRVRFTNPWDTSLEFEIAVRFDRSAAVGVGLRSWGMVKSLYR